MFTDYIKLEKFICDWSKKYNYFYPDGTFGCDVASDIAYDLKSDIEESEFNPFDKNNAEYCEMFDEWYDDFAYTEILPLLLIYGAKIEEHNELDFVWGWLENHCEPFLARNKDLPLDRYNDLVIYKSVVEDRYFVYDPDTDNDNPLSELELRSQEPISVERLAVLLYNTIVCLEEYSDVDLNKEIGITDEEYKTIMVR